MYNPKKTCSKVDTKCKRLDSQCVDLVSSIPFANLLFDLNWFSEICKIESSVGDNFPTYTWHAT